MGYSQEIAARVKEYLQSQEWNYDFNEEKGFFEFGMNIKSKLQKCKVMVIIRENGITCRALSPMYVDPESRAAAVEYITRANYGLISGNFEFDYNDGEIAYKTYLRCEGTLPDIAVFEHTIDTTFFMLQRYGDGLTKVLFAGMSPEEAVKEAETD